jgi:hypothetical protein
VQYERNVKYFKALSSLKKHSKSEIDLVIVKKDTPRNIHISKCPLCVIEIKFIKAFVQSLEKHVASPTDSLYKCLYDLEFIEQCKENDIDAISIMLSDYDRVHTKQQNRKMKYSFLWSAFRCGSTLDSELMEKINKESNKR